MLEMLSMLIKLSPVAAGALVLSVARVESCLIFLFVVASLEGTIRHYLSYSLAGYVLSDAVLVLIYFNLYLRFCLRKTKGLLPRSPMTVPVLIFMALNIIQVFNPLLPSPLAGLAGIKTRVLRIPLYFLGLSMVKDKSNLLRFITAVVIISTLVSSASILQFLLGPQRSAAIGLPYYQKGATSAFGVEGVGIVLRPVATTTGVASVADYELVGMVFSLGLLLSGAAKRKGLLLWIALVVNVVALLLSFTRLFVIMACLASLLLFVLSRRKIYLVAPMAGLAVFGVYLVSGLTSGLFVERFKTLADPVNLYLGQRWFHIAKMGLYLSCSPFGMGIGRSYGAVPWVTKWFPGIEIIPWDSYFTVLAGELSLLGLIVLAWILYALFKTGLKTVMHVGDPEIKTLGIAILAYLFTEFIGFWAGGNLDSSPQNLYFWFFPGVLMRLRTIGILPRVGVVRNECIR